MWDDERWVRDERERERWERMWAKLSMRLNWCVSCGSSYLKSVRHTTNRTHTCVYACQSLYFIVLVEWLYVVYLSVLHLSGHLGLSVAALHLCRSILLLSVILSLLSWLFSGTFVSQKTSYGLEGPRQIIHSVPHINGQLFCISSDIYLQSFLFISTEIISTDSLV